VVRQIRARLPESALILMGILPRGEQPYTVERVRALEANAQLAKLDDGQHVHYLYFGDQLLLPDGRMTKELAPDFLHPLERGYQIWMDTIRPRLDRVLGITSL
jgi:lysophospholipase L1-like esterase